MCRTRVQQTQKSPQAFGLGGFSRSSTGVATPGGYLTVTSSIPHPDTWSEWYPYSAPDDAIQRIETVHAGSPDGAPTTAVPDIARPNDVGELKARVSVSEAGIATRQQRLTDVPDAPNGAPTHTRGFVRADDRCEAIHAYATTHHLQVANVLDLAFHRFVAQVGQEVGCA
jgi:hypothetical protein